MDIKPTRRDVLKVGAAGAAGLAAGGLPDVLLRAMAAAPAAGKLSDIEHVVILIQENRSFDHYFGAYHGARGLNEYTSGSPKWDQAYTNADFTASGATIKPPNPLRPFHLSVSAGGACTHDIDHQWMTQHRSWNGGAMDRFLGAHIAYDQYTYVTPPLTSVPNGPLTMGYYARADLPFYYALADNFTLCDNYHTSAISGSAANWIYAFSGTIDPAGALGGPVLNTPLTSQATDYLTKYYGKMRWTTMMERLETAGVSWKFYNSPDLFNPDFNDNFLLYFEKFWGSGYGAGAGSLGQKAFGDLNWVGSQPVSFMADCANNSLPQVSWLIAPEIFSEHPPTPSASGQDTVHNIITALAGNQQLWNKTALFITWDDSGGWFDHVAPVTAPPGTAGEYLTASDALLSDRLGVPLPLPAEAHMPIGLGFRVPMLIVSPFTRNTNPQGGPMIASQSSTGEVYDHTSMLRFLETRFCVEAPNLTAWRRQTVGDLTGAFNFAKPDNSVPQLPDTLAAMATSVATAECIAAPSMTEGNHGLYAYQFPASVPAPQQEPLPEGGATKGPSGQVAKAHCVAPANPPGKNPAGGPAAANEVLPTTSTAPAPGLGLEAAAVLTAGTLAAGAWWAKRVAANRESEKP